MNAIKEFYEKNKKVVLIVGFIAVFFVVIYFVGSNGVA